MRSAFSTIALNSRQRCNPIELPLDRPLVLGVLNVTPDSFSDGGRFASTEDAIEAGLKLAREGADVVDVGGESTRPGSSPVPVQEELVRVVPVVRALTEAGVSVSIDTRKPAVALECLRAGAQIVNDIYALQAPGMIELCAEWGCTVCLMHMKGEPQTMQQSPDYEDVVDEVFNFLGERVRQCEIGGIAHDRIWIDPGIGFGKTVFHNLSLLRALPGLASMGHPVLVGVSRKSFLGKITGVEDPGDRLEATLAAEVFAALAGAEIIRTHDVRATRRALAVLSALGPDVEGD